MAALWWTFGTLAAAAATFSVIPRFSSPEPPPPAKLVATAKPVLVDTHTPAANAASAAVIIDAAPAPQAADTAEQAQQATPLPVPAEQRNTLDQVALASTPNTAKPASQRQPRPAKQARANVAKGANKNKDQEDLLGTLLGLIEGKKAPDTSAKPAASAPQTMDELVAKLDAEQKQRAEDQRKALEAVADKPKQLKR